MDDLASTLRELRRRALLTQEELARRSGVSVGTIAGVESGRTRNPRIASLRLLADAMNLNDAQRETLVAMARSRPATRSVPVGRSGGPDNVTDRVAEPRPLNEPLVRSLDQDGPRAEALATYGRRRSHLAEELGPDHTADVRRVLEAIVSGDGASTLPTAAARVQAAATVTAAQSPVAPFSGRDRELEALDSRVTMRTDRVTVVTLTGPAGVGKSALAIRWAHRRAGDRVLVCGLRGFSGTAPATAAEVMSVALADLGLAGDQVPVDPEKLAAAFRQEVSARCDVLVLDDAHDAEQVRAAIPAAAGLVVVVTSRRRLGELEQAYAAVTLTVEPLGHNESVALLSRLLHGRQYAYADVARLAQLCGGMPLALNVVSANILHQRRTVATYLTALGQGLLLDAFDAQPAGQGVRWALGMSVAELSAAAQDCLRMVALLPLDHVTPAAAAALMGCEVDVAGSYLADLADLHLLHRRGTGFAMHDLIREYAAEIRPTAHDEAINRLLAHYGSTATVAVNIGCGADEPPWPFGPPAEPLFADRTGARAWLDQELPNLVLLSRYTAVRGPEEFAWEIASRLMRYFWLSRRGHEWYELSHSALRAARKRDDRTATARALHTLGIAHWANNRLLDAIACTADALRINQELGRVDGQNSNLGNLAALNRSAGRLREASNYARQSVALARRRGHTRKEANATLTMTALARELGDLSAAMRHGQQALSLYEATADADGTASVLQELALVHLLRGDTEAAVRVAEQGQSIAFLVASLGNLTDLSTSLTHAYQQANRLEDAAAAAAQARQYAERSGDLYLIAPVLVASAGVALAYDDLAGAHEQIGEALTIARAQRNRYVEAEALIVQAQVNHRAGMWSLATVTATESATVAQEAGLRLLEAIAQTVGAEAYAADGKADEVLLVGRPAMTVLEHAGARPWAARCRAVLAAYDVPLTHRPKP